MILILLVSCLMSAGTLTAQEDTTRIARNLFVTERGVMGFDVSGGAAGGISLRGLSGGKARLMVLIDGHPQYAGIFGHPISDAYQSLLTDKVEVLRGPASVLYGSNAMGGVINIVTRKTHENRVHTDFHTGYGSYNTLETELTNRIRQGRFNSVLSGSYNHTNGHRNDMGFEQYGGYAKAGYDLNDNWNAYADIMVYTPPSATTRNRKISYYGIYAVLSVQPNGLTSGREAKTCWLKNTKSTQATPCRWQRLCAV